VVINVSAPDFSFIQSFIHVWKCEQYLSSGLSLQVTKRSKRGILGSGRTVDAEISGVGKYASAIRFFF
jgi:hypothetical protein